MSPPALPTPEEAESPEAPNLPSPAPQPSCSPKCAAWPQVPFPDTLWETCVPPASPSPESHHLPGLSGCPPLESQLHRCCVPEPGMVLSAKLTALTGLSCPLPQLQPLHPPDSSSHHSSLPLACPPEDPTLSAGQAGPLTNPAPHPLPSLLPLAHTSGVGSALHRLNWGGGHQLQCGITLRPSLTLPHHHVRRCCSRIFVPLKNHSTTS